MDLNAVRERINAIDDQIVDLFVERMKASADVASAKAEESARSGFTQRAGGSGKGNGAWRRGI